ncbi:MAG: DNA-3-methyladenine glycosylase 2 family protein [Chloroflexota bacterium]
MEAKDPPKPSVEAASAPVERAFVVANGADPLLTMSVLWQGPSDPQMRLEPGSASRAMRTSRGPATLNVRATGGGVLARAWGPGAAQALELVPGLIGALDDAGALVARHALVAELARTRPGLRLTRSGSVFDALVVSILGQKVTSVEARGSFRELVMRHGEPAPGPLGLRLPPSPEKLARLPYFAFHPLGVERRRADTIRAAAAVVAQLERIVDLPPDEGRRRLLSLPGVGEWTAAETMRFALGDPDAISVGDYHLPHLVCWALAGEARGTDERMLELLEPYRGQRARVALLLEHGGLRQIRRAPRLRSIASY